MVIANSLFKVSDNCNYCEKILSISNVCQAETVHPIVALLFMELRWQNGFHRTTTKPSGHKMNKETLPSVQDQCITVLCGHIVKHCYNEAKGCKCLFIECFLL